MNALVYKTHDNSPLEVRSTIYSVVMKNADITIDSDVEFCRIYLFKLNNEDTTVNRSLDFLYIFVGRRKLLVIMCSHISASREENQAIGSDRSEK